MRRAALSAGAVLLISADSPTSSTAKAAVDVGNIFAGGGTPGLVLYALILSVFLQFLALIIISVLTSRERVRAALEREKLNDSCHAQATEFAEASRLAAEALKDAATAIASSASADMTFKHSMGRLLERLELALTRFESRLQ